MTFTIDMETVLLCYAICTYVVGAIVLRWCPLFVNDSDRVGAAILTTILWLLAPGWTAMLAVGGLCWLIGRFLLGAAPSKDKHERIDT